MKRIPIITGVILLTLSAGVGRAPAQDTAFTYQGRLTDNGAPADGSYDLRFLLFNVPAGGVAIAGPITNASLAITGGLFTVMLDFGASVFDGSPRWLQIGLRTSGAGAITDLTPRQRLRPDWPM